MLSDIQENLDSVFSISWDNYQVVMEAFEQRLQQVDQVMHQLK